MCKHKKLSNDSVQPLIEVKSTSSYTHTEYILPLSYHLMRITLIIYN